MITGQRTVRRTCPCGWSGSYTTPGYADKAQRAHSCDVDWTPKPCPHRTTHQHGTRAAHVHCGCRCEPCRIATNDAELAMRQARAYGRGRMVDATPARRHVQRLLRAGMGMPRIAALSGVERSVLERLTVGKTRQGRRETSVRIARTTEAKVLVVTYDPPDGGTTVDGGTTARRLRALVALGWYPSLLARETGLHHTYIDRILRGHPKHQRVRPGTARRVHTIYQRLTALPPPSGAYADRARRRARAKGWQKPVSIGGRVIAGTALEEAA